MTDDPWRAPNVRGPDFSRSASVHQPVQIWYDPWRGRDRIVRYIGPCIVCGRRTWAFDDGENDPRGILGDAACWPSGLDYQGVEYDVTTCSICANEHEKYLSAQRFARAELAARAQGLPGAHPNARIRKVE